MGKDVFGAMRHACSMCDCKDYVCVIDTMTDEERAMISATGCGGLWRDAMHG